MNGNGVPEVFLHLSNIGSAGFSSDDLKWATMGFFSVIYMTTGKATYRYRRIVFFAIPSANVVDQQANTITG
jgi:hypothetical protein